MDRTVLGIGVLALCCAATAALAQPKQLTVNPGVGKDLARLITSSGFECPEVRAVYHVGADDRGNIMRVMCGVVGGPAIETPTFRMHSSFSGNSKITRWEQ